MNNIGISFINGKDIYTTYGASLIGSSFENLICRPDRKEGAENNMISHPGIQVFSDSPQPEAMEIELTFLIKGNSLADYLQNMRHCKMRLTTMKETAISRFVSFL